VVPTEDLDGTGCPLPRQDYECIVMGHGGGGQLTSELIEGVFLPAFHPTAQHPPLNDSTPISLSGSRIAICSDSFVVQPLFFPGGSIGELAVHGTVNDLAMSGAVPHCLTASFILEEGLPIRELQRIAQRMGRAAERCGVRIVAGDTKVVQRGHGDGCYITTSGLGVLSPEINLSVDRVRAGDILLISGSIGDHAMAVMSKREGLEFETAIESDTAALHYLVGKLLAACPEVRALRDPTRGGLAATLNEIAAASGCGILIDESAIPVDPSVSSACELLGLDPLQAANEGKFVAVVPQSSADLALRVIQADSLGRKAAIIGRAVADKHQMVIAKTGLGTKRVVPMPLGEQLPRIC
jgi:hydrogenase expression/formation protein HypE